MARIYAGALSDVSGKVGNVVGRIRLGTNVLAVYQPVVSNPMTPAQQAVRMRFGLISEVMSKCIAAVNWGLIAYKGKGTNVHKGITPANKFMTLNKEAVSGTYPSIVVDYSKLVYSKGGIELPANPAVSVSGANIVFSWTDNSGVSPKAVASDTFGMVAYNPQKGMCAFVAVAAKREDATFSWAYPPTWAGDNAEIYMMFANDEHTECSDSLYMGSLSI